MYPRSRLAVIVLLVVLLLFSVSCVLIPKPIQQIIDGFSEIQSKPEVIIVTPTPQSVDGGTSLVKFVIWPCLYNYQCPNAIDLDDLLNAHAKSEYEVKLPYDAQLKLSNGWVAVDEDTLEENLSHIEWILEVDGVDYYDPGFIFDGTVKTIQDSSQESPGAWIGVVIEGFTVNEPVTLVVGYIFTEAINDGWEDFPAGYTSTITYHFLPQPADYGSPNIN